MTYEVAYWEPIAFNCPFVIITKRAKDLTTARKVGVALARKKKLNRWQRVRQVDITHVATGKRIYLKQEDFK